MEQLLQMFTLLVVPYLIGILTKWLVNAAKTVRMVDDAAPFAKRALAVAVSAGLTVLASFAGLSIADVSAITDTEAGKMAATVLTGLSSLVSAIYAMVAHTGDKVSGPVVNSFRR